MKDSGKNVDLDPYISIIEPWQQLRILNRTLIKSVILFEYIHLFITVRKISFKGNILSIFDWSSMNLLLVGCSSLCKLRPIHT